MTPRLEVVCPVRNGGAPFRATLESLRQQAGASITLLISDNHSTDGSPWRDDLPQLAALQPRVIAPPVLLGRVEHWTWACSQSAAEIVKPLMVGDTLAPNYCAAAVAAFARHAEIAFVFCRNRIIESDKESVGQRIPAPDLIGSERFVTESIRRGNFVGALSGAAFRTAALHSALPFDVVHPWTADWRFYDRCLRQAPCLFLPDAECRLDRRIARYSSSAAAIFGSLREEWSFLRELAERQGGRAAAAARSRAAMIFWQAIVKYGRATIPQRPRKILGACFRALSPEPHSP